MALWGFWTQQCHGYFESLKRGACKLGDRWTYEKVSTYKVCSVKTGSDSRCDGIERGRRRRRLLAGRGSRADS